MTSDATAVSNSVFNAQIPDWWKWEIQSWHSTFLQSIMNAKLSQHRFWHCHENELIQTIQTIPHILLVSVKTASLYLGLG